MPSKIGKSYSFIVPCIGIIRIDPDNLVKTGNCRFVLLKAGKGTALVGQNELVFRINLQDVIKICDSLFTFV